MKKSKIIFAVIACITIALCAVLILSQDQAPDVQPSGDESSSLPAPGPTDTSAATTDPAATGSAPSMGDTTDPADPTDSGIATEPTPEPSETKPTILTPDYITTTLPTDHIADALPSSSGSYKNDRTVSIDIYDAATRKSYTISFGVNSDVTGKYLCLGPSITPVDKNVTYYFNFSCGAGDVITIPGTESSDELFYSFYRTLDDAVPAKYQSSTAPGTIWYTTDRSLKETWIDVRVYRDCCDMFATLRLSVKKDAVGKYYLAGVENLNMLDDGVQSELSSTEIDYLLSLYETDIKDRKNVYCALPESYKIHRKYMCCQWRETGLGTYYDYFNTRGKEVVFSNRTDFSSKPVVAITLRFHLASQMCLTVYYQVDQMPTQDSHGIYTFIGFDPWNFSTKEDLGRHMYPGYKVYYFD